jgi:hypothetical protein
MLGHRSDDVLKKNAEGEIQIIGSMALFLPNITF